MKRRQVLQSVGGSLVGALSLATISRTAEAAVLPPSMAQGELASAAELRTTRPSTNGARMTVRSYHSGLNYGGGDFIGYLSSGTDDGGTVFAGSGFYWRRIVDDPNNLTVFDFGAKADGKTDAISAVRAMFDWSKANYPTIGIQFPAGTFFLSGFNFGAAEIPFFRMSGAMVSFGYFAGTTLLSDGATSSLIKVNARRTEIANIVFKGQVDKKVNYQGFFDNICTGGQFFRGTNLRFDKVGGASISLMDTLDCKIDQFYASACTNDVIRARWSGRTAGNWDHSTAIELSNFNIQNCKSGKVFNLPRCTQSIMHNGWIEHCTNPGDISNGQWILDALSIEDCENPLNARNSRLNSRQINLQSGSSIDNTLQGERWLSAWEMGSSRVESFGAAFEGSLKYNFLTSRFRLNNDTGQATWFELGNFFTPSMGDSWEIELFGQTQYGNGSDAQALMNPVSGKTTGGRAIIHMQHKTDKLAEATWSAEGNSPVLEVRLVPRSATDTRVFVKIANWTPIVMVLMKTNGKDRYMAGQCIRFDAVMTAGDPPSGNIVAPQRFSLHNGKAGIGGNENGDLLVATRTLTAAQVDTSKAKGYMLVVINGEECAVPYFAVK